MRYIEYEIKLIYVIHLYTNPLPSLNALKYGNSNSVAKQITEYEKTHL